MRVEPIVIVDFRRSLPVTPVSAVRGTLAVPGDKSISHRYVMLAAAAAGTTSLANLAPGESVVDLGSGSWMDACYAAGLVGTIGGVVGVDFTPEQLEKARRLAAAAGLHHVEFLESRIDAVPLPDGSVDCVISNGVINLASDKVAVFAEAARLLRPGGRLAVADIVSERQLVDAIVCNADLWASTRAIEARISG